MKKTERFITKFLMYIMAILHLPWTIFRTVIAVTLLVDLWCDTVINDWLDNMGDELNAEKPTK